MYMNRKRNKVLDIMTIHQATQWPVICELSCLELIIFHLWLMCCTLFV